MVKKCHVRSSLVCLAALGSVTAQAADATSEALLAKMRNAYSAVKSARFTSEAKYGVCHFYSTVSHLAPSSLRFESVRFSEGKKQFSFVLTSTFGGIVRRSPQEKAPWRAPFSVETLEQCMLGVGNLETLCFPEWAVQLSTEPDHNMAKSQLKVLINQKWNGRTWTVLEESANKGKELCRYYVDSATFLIWRTTLHFPDSPGYDQDIWITKLKLGAAVPSSAFADYDAPKPQTSRR